ncbi:MAG: arginase family enzyme [Bradymonadia bacterium]|jgi:arginase family enzyme
MSEPYALLEQLMRPAGGGLFVVSTGVAEQRVLQQQIYGVDSGDKVDAAWKVALRALPDASVVLIGVPSDAGAGFTRGSNRGPAELRRHWLANAGHAANDARVLDLGDVRVVPQLVSEEMLSDAQISQSRLALYGDVGTPLPVSPLGITRLVLDIVREVAPQAVPIIVGGDHSLGWPAFASAFDHAETRGGKRVGLLVFDAHTDLLPERLGVTFCFATWAWHAAKLLGNDGRQVQIGVRASQFDAAHWERECGVRQLRPDEIDGWSAEQTADVVIAQFRERGVNALYISNDIDGTDPAFAAATGTPEPNGLHPDFVREVTERVAAVFPLIGADLVEVAPPLVGTYENEPENTLRVGASYVDQFLRLGMTR